MISKLFEFLAVALCKYGEWSAGLFSSHSSYEEKIPTELIEKIQNGENK